MFDFDYISDFFFNGSNTNWADIANTITDFEAGDLINLGTIDANTAIAGNQAFSFIGTADFSNTSGELRFETDGTDGYVEGDVDGDGGVDVHILLLGVTSMTAGDFVL